MIELQKDGKAIAVLDANLRWESENDDLEDSLNRATSMFLIDERHPADGDPMLFIANQCNAKLLLNATISDKRERKPPENLVY